MNDRNDRNRHALVVVTGTYGDLGLGALRAPAQDAEELADVLGDESIGGFDVEVLSDPTAQCLRTAVEDFFAERSPKDTLLLHFSCHGVKNSAGKLFLAATDTNRARLASTAVPAEFVSEQMLDSRAQCAVVFLDCCYAGAFERGMFARAGTDAHVEESFTDLQRTKDRRGRAVFTASSAVEYAFEGDHPVAGKPGAARGPSLFTGALVHGLRSGEADRDGDGSIGLSELADYVSERLDALACRQTPQLWLFGGHGDLPIARAKLRATRASPLPEALAAAVESDSRERKLWAVNDLSTLLQGADLGLALSAHAALSRLERDDSRRVADSADRALQQAQPRTATSTVDLGRVPVGEPGEPTHLGVEGPPVALATLRASTEPWLTTRCTADGLELIAKVQEKGVHTGTLTLQSATGQLTVQVQAQTQGMGAGGYDTAGATETPVVEPKPAQKAKAEPAPKPVEQQEHEPPAAVVRVWPFFWAAALMCLAFAVPLGVSRNGRSIWLARLAGEYQPLQPLSGFVTFVLIVVSIITCLVTGTLIVRASAHARGRRLRHWCGAVALLAALAVLCLVSVLFALGATSRLHLGCLALVVGAALQVTAAVRLHRSSIVNTSPQAALESTRLYARPFLCAAVLMTLALLLPVYQDSGDTWLFQMPYGYVLPTPVAYVVVLVSLTSTGTCGLMCALTWGDPWPAGRGRVRAWCAVVALLTIAAAFALFLTKQIQLGLLAFTAGAIVQVWIAVQMWRKHRTAEGRVRDPDLR
ncbi:caspase family protein [Streptomyces sp. KLMMK]|uniref:caspase family protein n=1 Tax=Streptomyces sp. KLMMK TaxID=3109353 RepID=UPI002FFEC450